MKTIAINALNSNSGGGKSIRDSYLNLLNEEKLEDRYVVLATKDSGLDFVTNPNIEIRKLPKVLSKTIAAPFVYRFVLGRILSRIGADVVFNLGDLIIKTSARQVYLFDWPYALEVHEKVWAEMDARDRLARKVKLHLLGACFRKADVVIAQTEHIRQMLMESYQLKDVRVIGNAVTLTEPLGGSQAGFDLPEGVRLLYPSVYYPHKNLEILLEVGELIKAHGLPYRIITTVNRDGSLAARRFVEDIERRNLAGVMTNIGQVPLTSMAALYRQCDALLMPTLLESFSIVYPEAMHYGLPIFTSDMWFAHSVCGEAAAYFDPFDAQAILQAVESVISDEPARQALVEAGRRRLSSLPNWQQNFQAFQAILSESGNDTGSSERAIATPPGSARYHNTFPAPSE